MTAAADFRKHLKSLSGRQSVWQVFRDFCELAYCALAKPGTPPDKRDALEARYMDTIGRYPKDEAKQFPALLGIRDY